VQQRRLAAAVGVKQAITKGYTMATQRANIAAKMEATGLHELRVAAEGGDDHEGEEGGASASSDAR